MKIAYSYIRFSSEAQGSGDSVRRQEEEAQKYALENGYELVDPHVYHDLGVSAYKNLHAKEGALAAFLKAVDDGLIPRSATLLVEAFDRLSRASPSEAQALFLGIINRGVTIVTVIDKQVFTKQKIDSDGGMSLLVSVIKLVQANDESEKKSKRVKKAHAQSRKDKKVTGNCPSWLVPNADRTGYELVHDKVATIRKIFELAAGGKGIYLICKHLNQSKCSTVGRLKDGWTVDAVGKLLKHQAVMGRLVSLANDEVVEDFYPAIIDKALYYDVREQIEDRNTRGKGRKGDGVANLFSGLTRCGCGSPMRQLKIGSGGKVGPVNVYLECLSAFEKRGCSAKRINYDLLEFSLVRYFFSIRAVEGERKVEDPRPELRARLHEKRQQIENLVDSLESMGAAQSKHLATRLQQREQEARELETKLRDANVPTTNSNVWLDGSKLFEEVISAEGEERTVLRERVQALLKRVVERIELPNHVCTQDGERWRRAIVRWRGDWDQRLRHRDESARDKYFVQSVPYDLNIVRYEQPQIGGKRDRGAYRYRAADRTSRP